MDYKDQLIIGLDVPTVHEAREIVAEIGDLGAFYKIGYQQVFAGGFELARDLLSEGKKVFLDMKLLDIDNTVAKGIENIAAMGITMTTVHAYPKTMRAAVAAAMGSDLCLLGVSVLTSMDDDDLNQAGYAMNAVDLVAKRVRQAKDAGMGGVVASALEAKTIRAAIGDTMALVTPGIRPADSANDDQKRVMTPADAIKAGASHLVVARPIVTADDKKAAVQAILDDMTNTDKLYQE